MAYIRAYFNLNYSSGGLEVEQWSDNTELSLSRWINPRLGDAYYMVPMDPLCYVCPECVLFVIKTDSSSGPLQVYRLFGHRCVDSASQPDPITF